MKLYIRYSSKWNFSSRLCAGESATSNIMAMPISKRTGLGIVARLLGQVDKLDKLADQWPFLNKISEGISIFDNCVNKQDAVFLRTQHQEDGNQQGGMAGKLLENELFSDPEIIKTYGILFLPLNDVIAYVLTGKVNQLKLQELCPQLTPVSVWRQSSYILSLKADISEKNMTDLDQAAAEFSTKNKLDYVALSAKLNDKKDKAKSSGKNLDLIKITIYPSQIYNFALNKFFLEEVKTNPKFANLKSNIPGFTSKNPLGSITPRAWIDKFVSRTRIQLGGVYKHDSKLDKGTFFSKSDGELIISLTNLSNEDEQLIKQSILDNGVTSFVLGKKGLAYLYRIE